MKNKAAYVLLKENDMKVHIKKKFLNLAIFFASLIVILFLFFAVLILSWNKDAKGDKIQQEKILQLINDCESTETVTFFHRSQENSFKYNVRLSFTDGVELYVSDVYLKDGVLYYGSLFWIGDYTEPCKLYYDGRKITLSNGMFKNIADSEIIEIYQNRNLSLLLKEKDKMLDFLKSFPFIGKETYKKIYDDKYKEELIKEFGLQIIYKDNYDGTLTWIEDNERWIVLDADCIFSRD